MRLAYADPPYPGKAHLYSENTEVDHRELIEQLCEYDGWALSTDERSLDYVLPLAKAYSYRKVRVLAWCRPNALPYPPYPARMWEPVLCVPARKDGEMVASFFVGNMPVRGLRSKESDLIGTKSDGFCEWVLRCLGAESDDTLADLFPGSGSMTRAFRRFQHQPPLFRIGNSIKYEQRFNELRRTHEQLPGMPTPVVHPKRSRRASGEVK